jgi:hypothetical protein
MAMAARVAVARLIAFGTTVLSKRVWKPIGTWRSGNRAARACRLRPYWG